MSSTWPTRRRAENAQGMFFIGRVRGYPVAREGAQKLKEVSYLHAEAYPASELKHGPLALVNPELPTVAIVPDDELLDKNLSTLGEIRARRGPVVAVAHTDLDPKLADHVIRVPKNEPELDPILLPCRCSCSRTTRRWRSATTWTSRATWPRVSRWSEPGPAPDWVHG